MYENINITRCRWLARLNPNKLYVVIAGVLTKRLYRPNRAGTERFEYDIVPTAHGTRNEFYFETGHFVGKFKRNRPRLPSTVLTGTENKKEKTHTHTHKTHMLNSNVIIINNPSATKCVVFLNDRFEYTFDGGIIFFTFVSPTLQSKWFVVRFFFKCNSDTGNSIRGHTSFRIFT